MDEFVAVIEGRFEGEFNLRNSKFPSVQWDTDHLIPSKWLGNTPETSSCMTALYVYSTSLQCYTSKCSFGIERWHHFEG